MNCRFCGRDFFGNICYKNHQKPKSFDKELSVCQSIRIYTICNKTVRVKEEKHECEKTFCKVCKEILPTGHFCYVQTIEPNKNLQTLFFFYDFETQQCQRVESDDKIRMHVPNCTTSL